MEDYKDLKDVLKPRRDFAASDELRHRISHTLDLHTHNTNKLSRWIWSIGVSCVAAALLILCLTPVKISARDVLTEALDTLVTSEEIHMTVEVRTRPMENFRYINIADSFVTHEIFIAKTDSILSWRMNKGGRTAIGNNTVMYSWVEQLKIGWKTNDSSPEELLGEMSIFLTPEKIIESELQNCTRNPDASCNISRKGNEIVLTVRSMPKGNFSNPYMLNTSIVESENIRRYVIDADTGHLKSASVSIVKDKIETEILKITEINYGPHHTDLMALPAGIKFVDMPRFTLPGLAALSASEAASVFLNALKTWDKSILDSAADANFQIYMNEANLKGAVLTSVGKSFTSGNEDATFVPYVLKLPNGNEKRHNLVLHKSAQGGWIVVGGL